MEEELDPKYSKALVELKKIDTELKKILSDTGKASSIPSDLQERINAITTEFIKLGASFDDFYDMVRKTSYGFKTVFGDAYESLKNSVQQINEETNNASNVLGETLVSNIEHVTESIEDLSKNISENLVESLNEIGNSAEKNIGEELLDSLKEVDQSVEQVSRNIGDELVDSLNEVGNIADTVLEKMSSPLDALKVGSDNIMDIVRNARDMQVNLEAPLERKKITSPLTYEGVLIAESLLSFYNQIVEQQKESEKLGQNALITDGHRYTAQSISEKILNHINDIEISKLDLAEGYYGKLTAQSSILNEILDDIKAAFNITEDNNKLAEGAVESAKEELNIKERLLELEKQTQTNIKTETKLLKEKQKIKDKSKTDQSKNIMDEAQLEKKAMKEREKEEKKMTNDISKSMDKIIGKLPGGSILQMFSKLGPLVQLVSILFGSILALVLRWDGVTANIAQKLSITRDAATATAKASGAFAAKISFTNIKLEQIADTLFALNDGFGGIDLSTPFTSGNKAAEGLIASGALLTDTFGLAGTEIAGMTDAATAMGMSLSSSTIMAVNMSKGIMSATKLMQSLANLSPKILTGFKGSNAELIGMVTKMKLLGVEANNIISSNDKLLDIESSISSAFEAQVATGANIDIDKLMSLQMSGNYQGVINEQLRTLQQANYLNMNPLGQELLASGLGLDRETASQMMLRKILVDKVGLTDELIEKRQREGQLLENDIKLAEKQGKITKLEADQLKKISEEYDNKTMQEKMMREFNDSVTALSSSLVELTDALRMFTDAIGKMTSPVKESLFSLGSMGTTIMSVLGGAAMVGSLVFMGKRGYPAAKAMANTAKSMFSGGSSVGSSAATAAASSAAGGSTAGMAQGSAVQAAAKGGKFGKFFGGMKGAGALGLLGAGIDFYGNLQSGQSTSEAATRAALTGGLGIAGGLLGSLIPIPGVGTFIGGTLGGFAGSMLGDLIYGDSSSQSSSTQAQRIQAKQQALKNYSGANDTSYTSAAISTSDVLTAITTMSAKIDTTNSLLNTMNAKPSEISVELDGEKVGKAVMNYSSGVIDRGRTVGNAYGGNRDQNATRVRK